MLHTKIAWEVPAYTFVYVWNAVQQVEVGLMSHDVDITRSGPHFSVLNNACEPAEYRGVRLFRGALLISTIGYVTI